MLLHPMLQFVMLDGASFLQEYAAVLAVPCFHVFVACTDTIQMQYCRTEGHKCSAFRLNNNCNAVRLINRDKRTNAILSH